MVEIYDTHEQSERVKNWLKENGPAMVIGLALAFGSLFGFKQWQLWNQGKKQQASAEFHTMVDLLAEGNLDLAVGNFEVLKSRFGDSAYASMAALQMGKARYEVGQADLAVGLFEDAMKNAEPGPLRIIARERLARVKLDQGDTQGALDLLNNVPSEAGFEAQFAELRGDAYRQLGDSAAALQHYTDALQKMEEGVGNRPLLEIKIEAVGGSVPAVGEAS